VKKIWLAMCSLLLALILITPLACTPAKTQITDTVNGFVKAYQAQEYDKALGYFSASIRKINGDERLIDSAKLQKLFADSAQLESIGEPSIDGKRATVWVDITSPDGTVEEQFSLVRENWSWKIDGF
jgi:hypothetical protein